MGKERHLPLWSYSITLCLSTETEVHHITLPLLPPVKENSKENFTVSLSPLMPTVLPSFPTRWSISVHCFSKGHHLQVYFRLSNSTEIFSKVYTLLLSPTLLKVNARWKCHPSNPLPANAYVQGNYHFKVCSQLWGINNKLLYNTALQHRKWHTAWQTGRAGRAHVEWILLHTYWVIGIQLRTIHENSVRTFV